MQSINLSYVFVENHPNIHRSAKKVFSSRFYTRKGISRYQTHVFQYATPNTRDPDKSTSVEPNNAMNLDHNGHRLCGPAVHSLHDGCLPH